MAGPGRPKSTKDMHALINKMLDKKDVMRGGKKISRREALVELLWQKFWTSQGQDSRTLHALLEYAGGKPVPMNQLPKDEEITEEKIDDLLEVPDYILRIKEEFEKQQTEKKEDKKPEEKEVQKEEVKPDETSGQGKEIPKST